MARPQDTPSLKSQSFALKGVQFSLVRPTKACFGWIPSNRLIFHHSSSFLMTPCPYSPAFVSFLSYHWLFNVATSFVNGPLVCVRGRLRGILITDTSCGGVLNKIKKKIRWFENSHFTYDSSFYISQVFLRSPSFMCTIHYCANITMKSPVV